MTVYTAKEYTNILDGGYVQMGMGNYRSAYDHFMACIEYKKRYEPWNVDEIERLQSLADKCNAKF